MERDYEWSSAVHLDDLMAPARVGRNAGKFAVRRLNPTKAAKRARAGDLRSPRLGRTDRPSRRRHQRPRRGARHVVPEGQDGRARSSPTASASSTTRIASAAWAAGRSTPKACRPGACRDRRRRADDLAARPRGGAPAQAQADRPRVARHLGPARPTTSNFYLEKGKLSVDELIGDIKSGLFITDLIGFGVNGVTGDYSRGASGFWIENGKLALAGERHHGRRQSQGHVPQPDAGQRSAVQELDQCADGAN